MSDFFIVCLCVIAAIGLICSVANGQVDIVWLFIGLPTILFFAKGCLPRGGGSSDAGSGDAKQDN